MKNWGILGFTGGSEVKASASNAGNPGSIRWLGEGNGNPLQYSCLKNPMDGGTWLGRSPGEGNGNPFQYSCLKNPMEGGAW